MRSPPPSWDQPSKIAIFKQKKTKTGTFHGDTMEIFIMGIFLLSLIISYDSSSDILWIYFIGMFSGHMIGDQFFNSMGIPGIQPNLMVDQ
jgi:hypothetical protein